MRVLVVDDEEAVRDNLAAYLEDEGHTVSKAEDGAQALAWLAGAEADVAIVDMRMPRMDGNTLIERAHRLRPGLRFLIFTGSPEYSVPPELLAIGIRAADVFYKPLRDMGPLAAAVGRRAAEE